MEGCFKIGCIRSGLKVIWVSPYGQKKRENDGDSHFLISREEQVQKEVHTFPLSSNSHVLPLQIDVQGTRSPEHNALIRGNK